MIPLDIDRLRARLPRPHYRLLPESIDSTMTRRRRPPHRRRGAGRGADRRPGPPWPLLALRSWRRHLLFDGAAADARCSPWRSASPPTAPSSKPPAWSATCAGPTTSCSATEKSPAFWCKRSDGKAIAGIGINVNHADFRRRSSRHLATSLRAGGRPTASHREDILLALLPAIDAIVRAGKIRHPRGSSPRLSSYASGRRVVVQQPEGVLEGTTAGLDADGFLIVRQDDGTDTLILAGGVRAAGS